MAPRRIPTVAGDQLLPAEGQHHELIVLGSTAWYAWLDQPSNLSFSYPTPHGSVTVRRERKRNGWYWYAYRRHDGRLRKAYIGRAADLTPERLREVAYRLIPSEHTAPDTTGAAETAQPEVQLQLLGAPALLRGGQQVTLANKIVALLAYLSTHDQPQSREQLLALLWPESAALAARKNLRNALWRLRTGLHPQIVQGDTRLWLWEQAQTDVRMFVAASRVLGQAGSGSSAIDACQTMIRLYRGTLLEGLTFDDAPEFELWLSSTREQFHTLNLQAFQALVDAYRSVGRWADIITTAHAALAQDALQESLHRALMEAHARLGDRASALRQYELLAEMLDRELGVAPLRETEVLRAHIRNGDLSEALLPAVAPTAATMHNAPASRPTPCVIGRAAELAALDAAWEIARSGRMQVVLFVGEAGIGKTLLWEAWSAGLDSALTVLWVRCLAVTQQLPFVPLVDMLRSPTVWERLRLRAQPHPPNWLSDVARLVPELRDLLPPLPPPPAAPVEEQRRVFEALVQSLDPGLHRPMVLFIDDLHWADRATLDWLGYLSHRAQDAPLLLVGACRPEELPTPLAERIAQWGRDGRLHRLSLARLSYTETATLVAALDGDNSRLDTLYAQSDGNPYFVVELLRAEPGDLPPALTDLIDRRLARLSEIARQVLQAAAVLLPEVTFALLDQVTGRSDIELLDALDELMAGGLLVEQGQRYGIGHPLIGQIIERSLGAARRMILHRRAAAALERHWAGRLGPVAGRLVTHYRETGDLSRAAEYAELAGDYALTVAAPVEAAHFYRLAIELGPAPARFFGLGRACYLHSDLPAARAAFTEAANGFAQQGNQRKAARACLELARSYLSTSGFNEVVRWVQQGRSYLANDPDPADRALAHYLLGAELRAIGQSLDAAAAHLKRAAELAVDEEGRALLSGILLELGNVRAQQGELSDAIVYYRELVAIAQASQDALHQIIGYNNIAYHTLLLGDLSAAHEAINTGLALAEHYDLQLANLWLFSTRGEIALAEGSWHEAVTWFRRGMIESERYGNAEQVVSYRAHLALAARGSGDYASALRQLVAAGEAASQFTSTYLQIQIDLWLAETYQLSGDLRATEAALSRAEAQLQHSSYNHLKAIATCLRQSIEINLPNNGQANSVG